MHLSGICKNTNPSSIQTLYNILVFFIRSLSVSFIDRDIYCFCVSKTIHQENNFLFFNFFLFIDCFFCIFYHCTAFSSVFFLKCIQFLHDDICHRIIMTQNILISGNLLQCLFMFFLKCFNFQSNQLIQTHLQNRGCLTFRKPKHCCHFLGNITLKLNILCYTMHETGAGIFD